MIQIVREMPLDARLKLCSICNSDLHDKPGGGHEPAVDTGIYIEFEGRLVICASCWGEGARLLGWAPPDRLKLAETLLQHAALKAQAQEALILQQKTRLDAIDVLIRTQPDPESVP